MGFITSKDSYTSTFSNKKLAILNTVLIICYLLYLAGFLWFGAEFFINTYSTEFNTAETIGFFLLICSVTCTCPVIISLCLIIFNTIKKRWIIYTPRVSGWHEKIDRYSLGIVGGLLKAIFLIIIVILFRNRFILTGFISILFAFLSIVTADVIGIILSKSYDLM